jgi:hypothetical protein
MIVKNYFSKRNYYMKKIYIILIIFFTQHLLGAQDQRALLIGIDKYSPHENATIKFDANRFSLPDLDGCKNDILSIRSVLGKRYGFKENNITALQDQEASRENILKSIGDLLNKSWKNDIAVIYYAGHGSQLQNSRSREADKKDETIVPADIWKEGIYDITDKQLAKYFNQFIDKEVKLTVIFDCCHSGSVSRGPVFQKPRLRYLPASDFDTKDASDPPVPEQRKEGNFLIISAAQDNEFAQELLDDNKVMHGAFTTALTEAIQQQPVDASAINIFTSLIGILKNNGKKQEPVIGGSLVRQRETLFGINSARLSDKVFIPVVSVSKDKIQLQGGYVDNLHAGNEITKTGGGDDIVIKINSFYGINQSEAKIFKGSLSGIKPGDLFAITNWVSSEAPLLKLFIPSSDLSYSQLQKYVDLDNDLKGSTAIHWVNDLEKNEPYFTVFFVNENCFLNSVKTGVTKLNDISAINLTEAAKGRTLFFDLPLTKRLTELLNQKLDKNKNIAIVNNANDANYIVYGTVNQKGKPAFGLLHPQFTLKDSLESLPIQSKYFSLENGDDDNYKKTVDSLYEYSVRLSKVQAWLNMKPPSGSYFPLRLQLVNNINGKIIDQSGDRIGDNLSLHIIADSKVNAQVTTKYIYVFTIDRDGKMQLIYPDESDGNVENKFPKRNGGDGSIVKDFELVSVINITEPAGTDSYFLLATPTPLSNYSFLFNQEGVRGLAASQNNNDPIARLLNSGNNNDTRGIAIETPSNWNLIRLSVKTKH